jgi:hypothetical protein
MNIKIGDKVCDKVDMTTKGVIGVVTGKDIDNFLVMIDDETYEVTKDGVVVRKI